ncbi:hypothetical protein [Blastococcus sp. CT_GayMR16]|uniref:hypothetical protein n=1 Tax=Blastococcus sp. CT_GayMR16 TaxID=2559607 RepID=UPI001430B571|nr:hypothetical protein [Blastococcus sp. CT_GayMR16]
MRRALPWLVGPLDAGSVRWTAQHAVGAGLVGLGLLLLAGVGGWLLGLRAGRRRSRPA